ncbi:hypothetical protein SALBM311S_08756 [Streptomyces alboniger]
MADRPAVQSRLFTITAAFSPSKDRNGSICPRSRATQFATVSGSFSVRSAVGRGSPIWPVAPPTRASGRRPACWSRRMVRTCTRWPTWRLAAVGSKPQ